MNFSSFGGNFQPPGHQHQQMVNAKLNANHESNVHYQTTTSETVGTDMGKYTCVSTMNGGEHNEVKYVLAPSAHHQYMENPQTQSSRNYVSDHHDQGEGNKSAGSSRTESRSTMTVTTPWQGLVTPGVADYLARLPASALPLSLHHFLKFSADGNRDSNPMPIVTPSVSLPLVSPNNSKKKTSKKNPKSYRPKGPRPPPAEIRLTTALDGSTLYCCPECHMAYPEKELLERHIMSHKLERRFVCDICGAGLKRKDHLTRHKQSHNPDRPYVCTICMKAFKRKEHLNLHFIMHSGEKSHVCSECGKGFYCKDHLDRHKQGHNPERPFICTICLKGFKRNEHLARHCIIHSGEKSQVCPECGKGFYRKDHLRKHLRSHVAKRVKTEQGVSASHPQPTVASLAAMVSMGSALSGVTLAPDGTAVPILSSAV